MKRELLTALTTLLIASAPGIAAGADTSSSTLLEAEARRTDSLSASRGQTEVQRRIASEFSVFAGSDANAQSLVAGLRNGAPITLASTSTAPGGTPSTTLLTFDPPTRPMGYGNVFISLALAKQQLAGYGINDPTPQEIQAALTGGTITTASGQTVTLQGVLTQRASGQGWGTIARSQGANLGQVVSALKRANVQVTASGAATTGVTSTAVRESQASSVSTANQGRAAGNRSPQAHGRATFDGGGSGIVSAGGSGGGVNAGVNAGVRGHGAGAGIVTGAGAGVSARGGVNPGLGKGRPQP
jgi:hypothetical protein